MSVRHSVASVALIAAALLAGCGGGGGSSAPAVTVTASPAAAGVTLLGASGGTVSATLSGSAGTAVLALQDETAAASVAAGGRLATFALTVTDTAAQNGSSAARKPAAISAAVDSDGTAPLRPERTTTADAAAFYRRLQTGATAGRDAAAARRTAYTIGQTNTFAVQAGNISGSASATPIPVPATLEAQSAHANIWLDNSDAANASAEYPSGVSVDMNAAAAIFEQNYAIETAAYGPAYTTRTVQFTECSGSGATLPGSPDPGTGTTANDDPHVNVLITKALSGSGEGGYFYAADMLSQSEANCVANPPQVNNLKMFVIGSDQYPAATGFSTNKESYWLKEDMPQTMGHEFQHYLHYINKFLQQIVTTGTGTIDNSYVDEGCSVLAQDLVAAAAGRDPKEPESPVFVRSFLLEPNLFSLTAFSGFQPDPGNVNATVYGFYHNTAGNYGLSYLFLRYLYDRFGAAALQRIYAEQSTTQPVDTGPVVAAANGEAFPQVYAEFVAALAVHVGGAGPEITGDPRFSFSPAVVLRGPVVAFSRRTGTDVRTIVQPGPLNPEVFSGSVPQPNPANSADPIVRAALAPGASLSLTLIAGAPLFLTPSGTPAAGAALRAVSSSAAFAGSLGQGPIPTPAPAFL